MARKQLVYLIVRADGTVRAKIYARRPNLRADEIAFKITLNFPDGWGRIFVGPELDMPAVPTMDGAQPA